MTLVSLGSPDRDPMHGYPYRDEVFVSLSNRQIPIRIAGRGQPILLLHGYPLDGRMWERLIPLLAMDCLCIAPDLRGFGRSAEEAKSFSIADLADDCAEILDVLQCRQPVVVCGLSMGGYVAMQFAERHSERIASLILTNTRANADDSPSAANRRAVATLALTDGVSRAVLPMLEKLLCSEVRSHHPDLVKFVRSMLLGTRASTIAWAQLAMAHRVDFRTQMLEWDFPVVCVAGTEDTITPREVMEQMSSLIPGSQMKVVANSAHLTPLERPDEFAKIVREAIFP